VVGVRLMGGLGNQMFQYAFARTLADQAGCPLYLDVSFLKQRNMSKGFVYRDYDLDIFSIRGRVGLPKTFEKPIVCNERSFKFDLLSYSKARIALKSGRSIMLNGFWQSISYFQKNHKNIRADFTFQNDIWTAPEPVREMAREIISQPSVMLNIRRTDFIDNAFHGLMGMDYIMSAVKKIESKEPTVRYFIFSDDLEWCEKNIKLPNMTLVDHSVKGPKFSFYMQLMILCDYYIIPNSTFAWWAAYLEAKNNAADSVSATISSRCNRYKDIVIAPKRWFVDESINTKGLIPKSWVRI
jgi:hypothetical protein